MLGKLVTDLRARKAQRVSTEASGCCFGSPFAGQEGEEREEAEKSNGRRNPGLLDFGMQGMRTQGFMPSGHQQDMLLELQMPGNQYLFAGGEAQH